MARVHGMAHAFWESVDWEIGDRPEWKLIFKQGWERNLRIGGYYAGHTSLSDMKEYLKKQNVSPESEDANREESSSWKGAIKISTEPYARAGFDYSDEDDEVMEQRKRRNTILSVSEGSDRKTLDDRQDKASRSIADNRSRALILAAPRDFDRIEREADGSSRHDAHDKAREVSGDNMTIEDAADKFFLKCTDRLVPITNLPICIRGTLSGGSGDQDIFLTGKFAGGRTKSFPVDMWRPVLSPGSEPCLLVKTTKGFWLQLLEPAAHYLKTISDGYILTHFLDFVKKYPSASATAVEKYLAKQCSMYGSEPFLERLSQHLRVIRSYVEEDEDLRNASVLRTVFPNIFIKDIGDIGELLQNSAVLRGDSAEHSRQLLRSVLGLYGQRPLENETEMDNRRQDMAWGDALSAGESSGDGYGLEETFVDQATKAKMSQRTPAFESAAREDKKLRRTRALKHDQGRHDSERLKNDKKRSSWPAGGSRLHSEDSNVAGGVSRPKGERKSAQRSQTKIKQLDDPPICIICDDGGDLLICDGPCNRYFHGFSGTGIESFCQTLSLSQKDTKGDKWFCKNCEHKQHQCFICNELGSTDTALGQPEIYMCEVPSCKRFYHAHCVAELVDFPNWRAKANGIRNGTERLICPRHKCDTCRCNELTPGKLVQCRRCPKAWHRECFTNYSLSCELRTTTIWNHDGQEFVYCRQHKINPTLMTPDRNHIRFPEVLDNTKMKKIKIKSSGMNGTVIERQYCEYLPPTSLAAELGLFNQ